MSVNLNPNNNSLVYENQFSNNLECLIDAQPTDIIKGILYLLDHADLEVCREVCKRWKIIASDQVFLESRYSELLANFGKLSHLPEKISQFIERPCPIYKGKKIKDTHVVFYKPKEINRIPYTIKNIPKIFCNPGALYTYQGIDPENSLRLIKNFENIPVEKEGWIAVTRNVLPKSKNKSFSGQQQLIQSLNEKGKIEYQLPKLIDVISAMFVEHLRSGKCLYSQKAHSSTYTHCEETQADEIEEIAVGSFNTTTKTISFTAHLSGFEPGRIQVGIGGVLNFQEGQKINFKKPPSKFQLTYPGVA
jgi:hypothetical protein